MSWSALARRTQSEISRCAALASIRDNNSRMFKLLGPDTGYDASHTICRCREPQRAAQYDVDDNALPKTILYTHNPKDYYPLATLMGCYQDGFRARCSSARHGGSAITGTAWRIR
jgi:glucuronate isomerase